MKHKYQQYGSVLYVLNSLGFDMPDGDAIQRTIEFVPNRYGKFSKLAHLLRSNIKKVFLQNEKTPTLKDICRVTIYKDLSKRTQGLRSLTLMSDDQVPKDVKDYLLFDSAINSKILWNSINVSDSTQRCVELPPRLFGYYNSEEKFEAQGLMLCNNDLKNFEICWIPEFHKKVQCFTSYQAQEIVTAHVKCNDKSFNVIIIHIIATHLEKSLGPIECADDIYHLVVHMSKIYPTAKILISQALPFMNEGNRDENIAITNELIKSRVSDLESVTFVEFNFGDEEVNGRCFENGGQSLSVTGIELVRNTLVRTVRNVLDLKPRRL